MDIWSVPDSGAPFCQVAIDARRMNVLNTLFQRYKKKQTDTDTLRQYHIWYPRPDTDVYELRNGKAPDDAERPQHLKYKNLDINLGELMDKIHRVAKDMDVQTSHDVSIAIGKIVGIKLPAFGPNHVPKKQVTKEQSSLYRPTLEQVRRLG